MDEREWIRRIQEGETKFLTPLIERHYIGIQKYCYYRVRSEEESKDLTQETFLRFCRSIEKYKDAGKCRAYLYTIARHVCNDYLRKWTPLPWEQAEEATDLAALQQGNSVEEQVEREQLIDELLQLLPEEQREAIFMRFCLDLTFRDIARISGMNVCVVQYRVRRGLLVLRRHLERSDSFAEETRNYHWFNGKLPFVSR